MPDVRGACEVKLIVSRLVYEAPELALIPETDYEAAVLARYWDGAKLTKGRAKSEDGSANGYCYSIKLTRDARRAGRCSRATAEVLS